MLRIFSTIFAFFIKTYLEGFVQQEMIKIEKKWSKKWKKIYLFQPEENLSK